MGNNTVSQGLSNTKPVGTGSKKRPLTKFRSRHVLEIILFLFLSHSFLDATNGAQQVECPKKNIVIFDVTEAGSAGNEGHEKKIYLLPLVCRKDGSSPSRELQKLAVYLTNLEKAVETLRNPGLTPPGSDIATLSLNQNGENLKKLLDQSAAKLLHYSSGRFVSSIGEEIRVLILYQSKSKKDVKVKFTEEGRTTKRF